MLSYVLVSIARQVDILSSKETNSGKHRNSSMLKFRLLKVSKILEVLSEAKRIKPDITLRIAKA